MATLNRFKIEPKTTIFRPDAEMLRKISFEMSNGHVTCFDNLNVQTKVDARSKKSTYIIDDDPSKHSDQCMTRKEADRLAEIQGEFIRSAEMICVDGYIGNDPVYRTSARLWMERGYANIAAMQNLLYYPLDGTEADDWDPELTVVYTPSVVAEGYPDDRCISVDLEAGVTRVMNSDYFGESKKGGLRMWNSLVFNKGGLALHAGCKMIPVGDEKKTALIVGLSGTGKTTTTFTRQNDSGPVQDDFVAMMADGSIQGTENGCFAKTFGLSIKDEPTIHAAVCRSVSYLENVAQNEDRSLDFFDETYTQNGRAVIRMGDIEGAIDAREVPKADFLLILNRNENIIPGVCKLDATQAAAYFMLGETQGTSAGGKDEAGKFLRVPGTNPFFPLLHSQQGNRFLQLLKKHPMEVYLLNTGRVGGPAAEDRSMKVKIQHSSAIVKGIAESSIQWELDPDFGYEVASEVPGIDSKDIGILQPRLLYQAQQRTEEYLGHVERIREERIEFLNSFPGLDEEITQALGV
ncbi:MAG: phosphoenolpyruvate carboxykinase [Planctomycetota bacterium]|nr:phosphoenolpyruvate carboxykinase [Planctomycetota bacterium]